MWNLLFYKTRTGNCPIADFIDELQPKLKAKALHDLDLLAEFGNRLSMPYSKSMGNGLFELRVTQSNNAARIFYFFMQGKNIVITNGFIKKMQKTSASELAKALEYKQDYQARNMP
ncbi:type II toxin-antitoxin system RelE/ParE family toxin [Bisgaard Taxon 10/6]|uniref:type II toxin-antitoxin system RelE/ParE family toxin n=1 Tax=Exercitatus varius TaxID=67857 RepID=UPI00294AFC6F|nr:type II toxin-antitoxin system RelE/ParE family toxin [Exercitatus varius]MDG2914480.1 type II toxin-antitoxin system RelE/ParE family toxin [Exercitatus varius]MDG2948102.1 type II toxin-antitoxin system RelE/ParE family toxin [Exercitatus varius]MDG2955193.1 type II toxin-antitoxin system RelE/ParE family toxin [Exercitatus varius]MDG2963475.1 type II toxin-antitoxin system RelE/ParE family toxin [Exercitatus varius]